MPTPHIAAPDGAFAPTVLAPGDPKRARYIADHHLDDAELITDVRAALGFTGTWKGNPVSVMTHGMGIPSSAIYFHELIREYGVRRLIRVGTAGVYSPDLQLRSVVAATGTVTNSNVPRLILGDGVEATCDAGLLESATAAAELVGVTLATGTVFTSDLFYDPDPQVNQQMIDDGVLAVEMETAGLYAIAHAEGIEALSLLTMTDHLVTGERLTVEERQASLDEMILLALNTAFPQG